jgi:ketosteroid isomerase-like protein
MSTTERSPNLPDPASVIVERDAALQLASMTYDVKTIRALITEDFTLISSTGRVMKAGDLLKEVGDRSVTWFANQPSEVNARVYNGDCAVVTAMLHEKCEAGGKSYDRRLRYTDTWVKLDGVWRYVAGHASALKGST